MAPRQGQAAARIVVTPTMDYEARCPLLNGDTLANLRKRAVGRSEKLREQLNNAAEKLGTFDAGSIGKKSLSKRLQVDADRLRLVGDVRDRLIRFSVREVSDGVRAFAEAVEASQNRLVPYTATLREYTAELTREVRVTLGDSDLCGIKPHSGWADDPVANAAIRTCESILAERVAQEASSAIGAADVQPTVRTRRRIACQRWPAAVLEWEARKPMGLAGSTPYEYIPESRFNEIVALRFGVTKGDLTSDQVQEVAAELCSHYGRLRLVPKAQSATPAEAPPVVPVPHEAFWKDRESEFREHETDGNADLTAIWDPAWDSWEFRNGARGNLANRDVVDLFLSLARLAGNGLLGNQDGEAPTMWLRALRDARSELDGKPKFAENHNQHEATTPAEDATGRPVDTAGIPACAVIEYVGVPTPVRSPRPRPVTENDGVELCARKQYYWESTLVRIPGLFGASARLCMSFRATASGRGSVGNGGNAGTRLDTQPPSKSVVLVSQPSRPEIERYVSDAVSVAEDSLLPKYTKKKQIALERARETHNSGSYLPALTNWANACMKATIRATAVAYVEAFDLYGVPAQTWVEEALETAAIQVGGGTVATIRGELALIATRTRSALHDSAGGIERSVNEAMRVAIKAGRLRLKRQRIAAERQLQVLGHELGNRAEHPTKPSRMNPTAPIPKALMVAEPATTSSADCQNPKARRGRPTKIPDERKAEALRAKAEGTTNRALAKLLYEVNYPNDQQVRNVSSILRHYRKSVALAQSDNGVLVTGTSRVVRS